MISATNGIIANALNKTRSEMDKRKKIEEILLNDYGCFDDFTVDKLCDLFIVSKSFYCECDEPLEIQYEVGLTIYCENCGKNVKQ